MKNLDTNDQELFKLALEAANIGVWELNTSTGDLSISDNIFKFLGISQNSFKGTFNSFLDIVHPDDRIDVTRIIDETIRNKIPFDTEFRILYKKKARWFRIRGDIGKSVSPGHSRIYGSIHDKTERKLAFDSLEDRVKERTSELEMINRQ